MNYGSVSLTEKPERRKEKTQEKCYACGERLKGKVIEIELSAMAWQTEPVLLKVWADVCPNGCKS